MYGISTQRVNEGIDMGSVELDTTVEINTFSFKKMQLKILSVKWRPFCPGGDELSDPKFAPYCLMFIIFHMTLNKAYCILLLSMNKSLF